MNLALHARSLTHDVKCSGCGSPSDDHIVEEAFQVVQGVRVEEKLVLAHFP